MDDTVARVRAFNRGWTEVLGLLDRGLLGTDHTLAEARVIFELAQQDRWQRLALRERLGMDASFLTRLLTRLEERGLVVSSPSVTDRRAIDLSLTGQGRRASEVLDQRSRDQIGALLEPLSADQQLTLVEAMAVISHVTGTSPGTAEVSIRELAPGDLGWVTGRHGAIYADEYGWNRDFEALVATIVADHHTNHVPGRSAAWIAMVDGARAGCVFCCEKDTGTAQLRILLVEPWARGLGLGRRLVGECIEFARGAGYPKLVLWTNDVLVAARRIYQEAGFELVSEDRHHSFGHDLVGQNWELDLN